MHTSPLTPQQALVLYDEQEAYLEGLTAEKAPTFLIEADPDNTDEPISLTFIKEDSLARVKEVLLAELRRSRQELANDLAAGITSAHYTFAQ